MNCKRQGFSLLEVIMATAILVSSSMVLLRLLSVGQRHQSGGERRTDAQIVAQLVLDDLLIRSTRLEPVEDRPVPGYHGWRYATEVESASDLTAQGELPLDRVRIRVFAAADDDLSFRVGQTERRPEFELVRWLRRPPAASLEKEFSSEGGQ